MTQGKMEDLTRHVIDRIARDRAVIVQPIGAIEQHGEHLPISTDALRAERMVELAIERCVEGLEVLSLPVLSYGKSVEHSGIGGTIALTSSTLTAVCLDLARSLAASGFRKLVFVNGHGGQPGLLDSIARDIRLETGLQVFSVNLSALGCPASVAEPDGLDIHAGRQETSIMLALAPHQVHLEWAVAGDRDLRETYAGKKHLSLEGSVPTAWLTRDLSTNGVVGDPTGASAEEGKLIVDHRAQALAEAFGEIAEFEFPESAEERC